MKDFGKQQLSKQLKRIYAGRTLVTFTNSIIEQLRQLGKNRTGEIYSSALASFLRFNSGKDIALKKINPDIMMLYESYLQTERRITRNSSSFYMRVLRAIYNRAVEQGITKDNSPFKYVYIGVDRTVKRALHLQEIKKISSLNLAGKRRLAFARDLFMFSLYTRGMSFIDMAYLKKSNLRYGVLTYRRRKTGQQLQIKWEKCMQAFIDKWGTGTADFLLPIIICEKKDCRLQYQSAMSYMNILLKQVGAMAGVNIPLTTYVARHSWASIARSRNIPLSVISEGMGHDSERTTQIYLSSLESSVIDRANRLVIKALQG